MQTRIHKHFKETLLFAASIIFFGSCSRQMTDISKVNKMQYAQTISKNTHPTIAESSQNGITASVETPQTPVARNTPVEASNQVAAKVNFKKHLAVKYRNLQKTALKMALVPAMRQLKQQLASNTPVVRQSGHTMAYHHTAVSGNLRNAIICFIVALILAVFAGIPGLGWIFYLAAGIFLVVGLIFLLFWLLDNV